MTQKYCLPIRVYVEDTDVGGIVYYANYLKYIRSAVLDDRIIATAQLKDVSRTSFVVDQNVLRGNDLLVKAEVKVTCIDREKKRPQAIPEYMLKKLKAEIKNEEGARGE